MPEPKTSEKLHAACDECRTRKLKCSGESPTCSRCDREKINCVYSPQKQMGRPRKRRREESAPADQSPADVQHTVTTTSSFQTATIAEFGYISPPELDGFPGFSDFQGDGAIDGPLISPLHADVSLASAYAGPTPDLDFNIDPSLWDALPTTDANKDATLSFAPNPSASNTTPDSTPCTCLSIMYLAISDLQSLSSFSFPSVIVPLRQAMNAASTMLRCEKCPRETFSTIQNVQSLSALLAAIAERFHKVLAEIDAEASRLELTGEKKPFRIGDSNPSTMHLHTATPDCPMGFNIELEAKDWRLLAKKALKTEVLGGGAQTPFVMLLDEMEQRQHRWHTDINLHCEERERLFGPQNCGANAGKDAHCVKMVGNVRQMVNRLAWD